MKITKGKIPSAQKVVIYGPEGIGKSTFASKFPDPLFSDTEGSTKHLDVARFEMPETFTELLEQVKYVKNHPDCCMTYVIDTADWAEKLCQADLLKEKGKNSIEDFGYGKGYVIAKERFQVLLKELETLVDLGINVVLTAHAVMRKFEQPDEQGAYDRWELKLNKHIVPIVKEWADTVLFVNYKTFVSRTENGSVKASGGERRMFTEHHVCWDAKNRWGLPEETKFDYEVIKKFIPTKKITQDKPDPISKEIDSINDEPVIPQELKELMERDNISESDIRMVVAQRKKYSYDTPISDYTHSFIEDFVIKHWDKIVDEVRKTEDVIA